MSEHEFAVAFVVFGLITFAGVFIQWGIIDKILHEISKYKKNKRNKQDK